MKVIMACEESQAVCKAFRDRGHQAYLCDTLPCSSGHPEWHIQDDVLAHLDKGWDMMIAFPPCTHIAVSGSGSFEIKRKDGRQRQGIDFFMQMINAPIYKIAVENPISIMSTVYRSPDQIIHPYYFGNNYSKATCLWLKNLPLLFHVKEKDLFNGDITHVDPEYILYNSKKNKSGKSKYSKYGKLGSGKGHEKSKFPDGIANAMAEQWG